MQLKCASLIKKLTAGSMPIDHGSCENRVTIQNRSTIRPMDFVDNYRLFLPSPFFTPQKQKPGISISNTRLFDLLPTSSPLLIVKEGGLKS